MKRFLIIFSILGLLFVNPVFAELSFPQPVGVVNDFAGILSEDAEQKATQIIEEIKTKTSAEVAVVTINSLEGNDANTYAVELGRAWGIGTKERHNGVLFLTAVSDRQTYIATGYGIEAFITDAQAFWITDHVVVPYFKNGDYDGGILAGIEKIRAALVDSEPLPTSTNVEGNDEVIAILEIITFALFFILPWVAAVLGRSKRWWPGGFVGAIVGVVLSFLYAITLFIIIPLAIFGFFIDFIASSNYKKGKSSWWTGGGSSGWGGGSSFGSGSSGGFGGFSGGSFGGGGAGSRW